MGYAILRAEKRAHRAGSAMIGHALRERPVANAVDGGRPPEVLAGATTAKDAREHLASLVQAAKDGGQRWRKDAVEVVDLLVTTSRIDMHQMDLERQRSYFRDALAWIQQRWPAAKVLTAAIHRDESTPHMQVLLAPTNDQGRFNAKEMLGGPADMSKLQDAFHAQIGAKYGLDRGERHSGAKHLPVRQLYAAMAMGAEPPKFVRVPTVPPPPTLLDKVTGKAGEIEERRRKADAARKRALEHNAKQRQALHAQAARARSMHPALVERQADRYRKAAVMEDRAKAQLVQARNIEEAAKQSEAQAHKNIAYTVQATAKRLDQFSRHWSKEYTGMMSRKLGIELVAGKGVLDQVRRAGKAADMLGAAEVVLKADDSLQAELHRWHERQQQAQARPQEAPRPVERPRG